MEPDMLKISLLVVTPHYPLYRAPSLNHEDQIIRLGIIHKGSIQWRVLSGHLHGYYVYVGALGM